MMRGIGITEVLSSAPHVVIVFFALVTQLGDYWFVSTACLLAYWVGDEVPWLGRGLTRERGALLLALLATATALTAALKILFVLPRPPGAGTAPEVRLIPEAFKGLYRSMATGAGYGFPSGHATSSLLMWGGFAWALRVGTRRQRYAVAGSVAALVGLSRLVLGVHYVVDILAGFLVAGAVLWVVINWLQTPEHIFVFAALAAVAGVLLGGPSRDMVAALGIAVGGAMTWAVLDDVPSPTPGGAVVTVALGAPVLAAIAGVILRLEPSAPVVALLTAVATTLLLAMPLAGERVGNGALSA
ncbi:phosphatase PAP2 family protein [Haloarcula amylovorans]|uniref:phosphatase PAP2 family protein n=1 Tax=Haloarcula amylovorans TaxID=2562280 RepID=UPI001075FB17|nr:phosphatase PAP2 family protein [Halomicroarcula amylolytica]